MSTSYCQNLTTLVVSNCSRLKFLFSYSMINSLVGLKELKIRDCESMEWIIEEETSSTSNSNPMVKAHEEFRMANSRVFHVFPQLTNVELWGLPKLKSIYQGMHILEWLALKDFKVYECHAVKILFGSSESKLLSKKTESQQPVILVDSHKVQFPSLEVLAIFGMQNLRKIWDHQLDNLGSFGNLKRLDVMSCGELTNVFPLNLVVGFERLDCLYLGNCDSIEEIIEEESSLSNCTMEGAPSRFHVFSQLTKLKLWELPKLKSIYEGKHALEWAALKHFEVSGCREVKILFGSSKLWSCEKKSAQPLFLVDRHKVVFPNLTTLKVWYCHELRFLTTFSTVESLVKLTKMEINYCEMIEKIIEMQVGEEVKKDPIVFGQLEYLKFAGLSRLESFCSENYTLEFSYLKQVMVLLPGCNELKLSQFSRLKEMWHDQALPVSSFSYLRILEVDDCTFMTSAIPTNLLPFLNNLTKLKVRNCDSVDEVFHLEELNANEPLGKLFPQLSWLHLIDLPKLKTFCNFNGNIIELPNLSSLRIENCPDIVTFIANSTPVQPLFNEKVAFHNLEELKLSKLAKLLHLCEETSHPNNVFQNLTTLRISECCKLEKLVPSWVSFQNLTFMKVSKCDGLINLMTLSTAKSLVRLRKMMVINCQSIEEIMHVEDEVKEECIVFSKLKFLGLIRLPSFTSFCLEGYALEFPTLKQVIVKECPNIQRLPPELDDEETSVTEEDSIEEYSTEED